MCDSPSSTSETPITLREVNEIIKCLLGYTFSFVPVEDLQLESAAEELLKRCHEVLLLCIPLTCRLNNTDNSIFLPQILAVVDSCVGLLTIVKSVLVSKAYNIPPNLDEVKTGLIDFRKLVLQTWDYDGCPIFNDKLRKCPI